jgi:hypothetical protein
VSTVPFSATMEFPDFSEAFLSKIDALGLENSPSGVIPLVSCRGGVGGRRDAGHVGTCRSMRVPAPHVSGGCLHCGTDARPGTR